MENKQNELGPTLWDIAKIHLRGNMKAGDFQDYMLAFIFLYYISKKYSNIAIKELGSDYKKIEEKCNIINDDYDKNKENYKKILEKHIDYEIKLLKDSTPDISKDTISSIKRSKTNSYNEYITGSSITPLTLWYLENLKDINEFESYIKKKMHFIIRPQYLWDNIYSMAKNNNTNLLSILVNGFKFIEEQSFNVAFDGLFSDVNLNSEKLGRNNTERNAKICSIIRDIGNGLENYNDTQDNDILGDAYEFLISKFASNSGTKAGEFYTPQEVSNILSEIVTLDSQDPAKQKQNDIKGILDFACGSGSLLINIKKHIDSINKTNKKQIQISQIYGQEKNVTTYNLARMNMILHGIKDNEFEIYRGDTLLNDWSIFKEKNPAKKIECDIVVANPPFSQVWEHNDELREDFRFSNYGLAPRSNADFAFLLHGFHFLKNNGIMAIILPHGVLFRGGEEGKIRQKLVDDNNIDTIIGLPSNLFYSTGIPVCIIVLKKCKKNKDILFINADRNYEKDKSRNILLDRHVEKIINTYKSRESISNYSQTVSLEEIQANDYNLSISRYVSTAEEDKIVDLDEVMANLNKIEDEIKKAKDEHNQFLKELGLPELK